MRGFQWDEESEDKEGGLGMSGLKYLGELWPDLASVPPSV